MTVYGICSRTAALTLIVIVLVVAGMTNLAYATLGENVASVQSDQARMHASVRMTSANAYTLHELQAPNGTVIREYVSPAGTVFGVAWQGQSLPDLRQLLGTYFDQYAQAMQQRGGHGPRLIQQPGLVVQVSGHQRALSGRAYIPQMVPDGVPREGIR